MKVLHVINSLNTGGAEKLIIETLPLYNKSRIKVDLLLLDGKMYPFLEILEKQNICKIFKLNSKSLYNPLLILKIIPYLKKYDIIHTHLFPSLYWVALAKFFSFNQNKYVYTEHSTNNRRRNTVIFKCLDRFIYKRYNKIITISKQVNINLKSHLNFNLSKFKSIPNGVNTKLYNTANAYNKADFFSNEDVILTQVSSFRKPKDQKTVIKTLLLLPNKYKLILVGNGVLLDECKQLVKKLGLLNRVKFLGIRMDVPNILQTADIIILSSFHEGLSLSSIEAMATGKPFIASNVPGLTKIVKGAGLLFEKENQKQLAKHIIELSNKEYYNEISEKCKIRAERYDIKFMIDKSISLYNEIINL